MAEVSRRQFVGQAAAIAGGAALTGTAVASAAPAISRATHTVTAQDKTEIMIYHIFGTPPGGTPAETPHPMTQVIDAFNAQSEAVTVTSLTPGNYLETLQKTQADIAAGNPPDLVTVPWANSALCNRWTGSGATRDDCRRQVRGAGGLDVRFGLATGHA